MQGCRHRVRRMRFQIGLGLCCLWLVVGIAACKPTPPPEAEQSAAPAESSKYSSGKSPAAAKEILTEWKDPRAVLVFTGDVHGYLEPCGCAEKQLGGFARRGGMLKWMTEVKKWPYTAFDLGGSLNEERITYPQTRIKFSAMLQGLNELGYQGQGLGKEELLMGAQNLYTEFTQLSAEDNFHVPFLSASTTIFGSKDLGTPIETRVVEVNGLKIGVTSIAGKSAIDELESAGVTRDAGELLVQQAKEVLPAAIEKLKAENPDFLVLLSASTIEESEALAKEFPEFKIVVTGGSAEDPRLEPVYVGETMLVQVGKKGKNAALVGIFPDNQLKFTILALDQDRFEDLPAMHDLMQKYQDNLKAAWPELTAQKISDPNGKQFVGAQECKDCHTYAYGVWSNSKHAHAFESLEKGRPGMEASWISRIWDPECLACHTTGWDPQKALRYQSGFIDLEQTPMLAGQQCENCHGAGSEHVALEKVWKRGTPVSEEMKTSRDSMRLTLTRAKSEVCLRCHDGDNSPHFDFDKYWPKVNHTGRKD